MTPLYPEPTSPYNEHNGLCACGCGQKAPIAQRGRRQQGFRKGEPLRFCKGHHRRGQSPSAAARAAISVAQTGRKHDPDLRRRMADQLRGRTFRFDQRINQSRGRTGREPVVSPYVPDCIACYNVRDGRWTTQYHRHSTTNHARLVYEHYYEPIPAGCVIHHRDGQTNELHDDRPDNLMAVPEVWNWQYFPRLARGFDVPQSLVTQVYAELEAHYSGRDLFREVCAVLVAYTEEVPCSS